MKKSQWLIPLIVISQFAGTSLWFAGNAVIADIQSALNLEASALSYMTSAVQFGFITGTLVFAVLTISDRFSPSRVFFVCALLGALANLGIYSLTNGLGSLLFFRMLTGFFLAGIYPVGMKIASDHHEKGLGKALGYLVGALVLGTALPHFLKNLTANLDWQYVILLTSGFAAFGGLVIWLFVPDGPYRKKSSGFDLTAFFKVFQNKNFRAAAFGYFGHMWELYAFWAYVPLILISYNEMNGADLNVPLWAFFIIAMGGPGCVLGGYISLRKGSAKVAFTALLCSGLCCLLSPLIFKTEPVFLIIFLLFWGMVVVTDSPQFSTLVAQTATKEFIGTALTIVNCIGFSITIFSIQLLNYLMGILPFSVLFLFLLPGPVFGLWHIYIQLKPAQD